MYFFFFSICSQSHISHYYVRSGFPHCNGSQLQESPNPAWPPSPHRGPSRHPRSNIHNHHRRCASVSARHWIDALVAKWPHRQQWQAGSTLRWTDAENPLLLISSFLHRWNVEAFYILSWTFLNPWTVEKWQFAREEEKWSPSPQERMRTVSSLGPSAFNCNSRCSWSEHQWCRMWVHDFRKGSRLFEIICVGRF